MPTHTPSRFTFAISSYDHVEPVVDGRVPIVDADPLFIRLPIPEMFRRFVARRDWDVSEMPFVQYATLRANGDPNLVGLPVFPSRLYRQTAIFVRSDRIRTPEDLRGGRIGIVAWANSAAVWGRGLLADMHGISSSEITWYQGGVERPGRPEIVKPRWFPEDVTMIAATDRGIEEMLWSGDLEAIILPSPPDTVNNSIRAGGLVQLPYEDFAAAERDYRLKTRSVPIMHTVAMTRDLYERDPDVLRRIYEALERARAQYFEQLTDLATGLVPIPWIEEHIEHLQATLGADVWPYGVEPNRPSFETALRYARNDGLIAPDFTVEDLYPEWQEVCG
jgi:4,5-dihydroxyphthalate decarboxylase